MGNINVKKTRKLCVYRVTSLKDLNDNIIVHFTKYPLISSKNSDFLLWTKVVEKMLLKEHLENKGFCLILKYYASINRGVSNKVNRFFPNIVPYRKVKTTIPNVLNPNWVSGFVAGDGSFTLGLRKSKLESKALGLYFNFSVIQHSKDYELIKLFILFFNCGNISTRINEKTTRCDYYVQNLESIIKNIIPHFDKYPLENIKELDFLDFKTILNMIWNKEHLIAKNRIIISNIINRMNNKRY